MAAVIDGLSQAQQVLEVRAQKAQEVQTLPPAAAWEGILKAALDGETRFNSVIQDLKPFLQGQREMRERAETLQGVYLKLAVAQQQQIGLMKRLSQNDATTQAREISRLALEERDLWRLLTESAAASAHALVDSERSPSTTEQRYLAITDSERNDLLQRLQTHFPNAIKEGARGGNQRPPEAAAALLWQRLNGKEWLPSDAR
jgi:hypothetical protein